MPFAKTDAEPVYLTQMKALLRRHPKTSIIWAHIGLGRIVHPVRVSAEAAERNPSQLQIVEAMLTDPALSHVTFDISWDEVAKYAVATPRVDAASRDDPQSLPRPVPVRHRHRGAGRPGAVLRGLRHVDAGLAQLTPDASQKVRKGNYERIFDEARREVRAWEQANVH